MRSGNTHSGKPDKVFVVESSMNGGTGMIRLTNYIGGYSANAMTVNEVLEGFRNEGVKHLEVYISSPGGSVFEAVDIAHELARFENVLVKTGALVASAGTYLLAKFKSVAKSNTQFMIHKPRMTNFSGTVDDMESSKKLLENVTADYLASYAKKTGKTEEEIATLWAKGDYWMNAEEALSLGFIDDIEEDEVEITVEDVAVLEAVGAPLTNFDNQLNKNEKMSKTVGLIAVLASVMNMEANASEESVLDAVKGLKAKADAYEALKQEKEDLLALRANTLIDKAIAEKKIAATQKEHYLGLAQSNYESVEAILTSAPSVPKLSASLNPNVDGKKEEREGWTLEDYLEKDPQALAVMEKEQPEVFASLNEGYFGKI